MARDRILQIYRGTTAQNDAFTGAQGELTMDTARKEIRIHDGSTAGGNVIGLTPGFIAPFAGSTAPAGWLVCDGSAVSRTTYAKLFAVIGTTYGEGDGNTTFNLPDYSTALLLTGTGVGVKGNGKSIGFYNGSQKFALTRYIGSNGIGCVDATNLVNVGTSHGYMSKADGTYGVIDDTAKSGLDGSITSSTPLLMCIKY